MTATAVPRTRFGLTRQQRSLLFLNVAGGAAVLGSYWHGIAGHPDAGRMLWGNVPEWMRPLYTVSMLTAATGYFPFTLLLLVGVDPDRVRAGGRFGFRLFHVLYALILVPSALWMPLTFRMLETGDPHLWTAIRGVLLLVGLGSVGLLAALVTLTPRPRAGIRALAIAGAVAFSVQTAVLDAAVWPFFFPVPGSPGVLP